MLQVRGLGLVVGPRRRLDEADELRSSRVARRTFERDKGSEEGFGTGVG